MTDTNLPPTDSTEAAFRAMAGKLAGLIAAMDGFAARQQELHARDYTEDLARLAAAQAQMGAVIAALEGKPALVMTPEVFAQQMARAAAASREEDARRLVCAEGKLNAAASRIETVVNSALTAEQQVKWGVGVAVAGLLVGLFFGSFVPAGIDRMMPASWLWPEQRAASDLGMSVADAGMRLLQVGDPERWEAAQMVGAVEGNGPALRECAKRVVKKGKMVECSVMIRMRI